MCSIPESGNYVSVFQSGSKYYLWDPIQGTIWEIVTSMDLVDLVTEFGKVGLRSLKLVEVLRDVDYRGWKIIGLR